MNFLKVCGVGLFILIFLSTYGEASAQYLTGMVYYFTKSVLDGRLPGIIRTMRAAVPFVNEVPRESRSDMVEAEARDGLKTDKDTKIQRLVRQLWPDLDCESGQSCKTSGPSQMSESRENDDWSAEYSSEETSASVESMGKYPPETNNVAEDVAVEEELTAENPSYFVVEKERQARLEQQKQENYQRQQRQQQEAEEEEAEEEESRRRGRYPPPPPHPPHYFPPRYRGNEIEDEEYDHSRHHPHYHDEDDLRSQILVFRNGNHHNRLPPIHTGPPPPPGYYGAPPPPPWGNRPFDPMEFNKRPGQDLEFNHQPKKIKTVPVTPTKSPQSSLAEDFARYSRVFRPNPPPRTPKTTMMTTTTTTTTEKPTTTTVPAISNRILRLLSQHGAIKVGHYKLRTPG